MNNLFLLSKEFENRCKAQGQSPSTIKEVVRRLGKFLEYLAASNISNVDQITKDIIQAYQVGLYQVINQSGKPNSVPYQNLMLSSVKLFMKFLKSNDYIVSDPSEEIAYAKEPKRLPRGILTPTEARKIVNTPNTKTVLGYRDRTIMEVLYTTGIRRKELQNLTLNDVDYRDGFLRVTGKGNKERIVPIGKIACRYLENYIKSVRSELIRGSVNNYLFLSLKGNKLSNSVMVDFMKKYAKKAKLKKKVTPHTFRHTCATAMLKNKANIRVVQELLGHSCISSTQIYTHVTIMDLKKAHRRCHPREQDKE